MTHRPSVLWVSHTGTWVGPTHSLSLLLEDLDQRVASTVLLTDDGAFTSLLQECGVPYVSFRTLGRRAIPAMVRLFRKERFDLVYTNNTSSASANAAIAAMLSGIPRVTHIRSVWSKETRFRSAVFSRTDAQVAVSRATAEAFVRQVPTAQPYVVYNGVRTSTSEIDRDAARKRLLEELSLPERSVLILNLAHIMPRKGQVEAVDAYARVAAASDDAVFLLVGRLDRDASYVDALRRRADELGIQGRLRLLGFRRDVAEICRAADIQVHTALVDPHPRAVIEGMAARLPTVAFSADGVGETVVDGRTGVLCEVGDTSGLAEGILRLLRDADLRERMGERACERTLKKFTAEATARQVGDVIDTVLQRTARTSLAEAPLSAKNAT